MGRMEIIASMAAESNTLLVHVKCLDGELLQLQTNPSRGLEGVKDILIEKEPARFPLREFLSIQFVEEDQKELAPECLLAVLVTHTRGLIRSSLHNLLWNGYNHYYVRLEFGINGVRYFLDVVREVSIHVDATLYSKPGLLHFYFSRHLPYVHPDQGDPIEAMNNQFSKWFPWITRWDLEMSEEDTQWILEMARTELIAHWEYREIDFTPPVYRKVECECGKVVRYGDLSRHRRSHSNAGRPHRRRPIYHCPCGAHVPLPMLDQHIRAVHDPTWKTSRPSQ
jgi:hypothetical protein